MDNCSKNYTRKKNAFCGVKNLTLITPSNWLSDLVKKSFLNEYDVKVVNNKIDETIFCPTPSDFRLRFGLENKKIILGVASTWDQRKGLEDFLELNQMLDDSWKVVLVGLTEKQVKYIPKDILCIKRTSSALELAEIYTAADVFLNLTYEDNYPTVNLEAQACGTPCITYNTGGSIESVPQKHIVEQHDLDKVISLIRELVD
jgi:glycosyltransferase involved in cell wall biosynthesis